MGGGTAEAKTGKDEDVWAFRRVEESPIVQAELSVSWMSLFSSRG